MQRLILSAALLFIPACATGAPDPVAEGLCRPADEPASVLEIGGVDLTGQIMESGVEISEYTGQPQILLKFDADGAARLAELTGSHIGEALPLSIDGEVLSALIVREVIPGGHMLISGDFTIVEAQAIALRIAPACP